MKTKMTTKDLNFLTPFCDISGNIFSFFELFQNCPIIALCALNFDLNFLPLKNIFD